MADDKKSEDDSISMSMRVTLFGIRKAFPKVKQLETEDLENLIKENCRNLILLDVRRKEEYAVSHLPGSIHIDPDETAEAVFGKVKPILDDCENGKVIIVCYCSLGYRSSLMAQKLYPHCKLLAEAQKISFMPVIQNLEGSIFKWANEGREMIDNENRKTKCCHPNSFLLGKIVKK
ncbi:thiosulfate:glutathione sulfurtransferase-like [Xenia sp. Carnegie-2017]|uniref:thiosulfate:glutathione sulfurtransferase-like n=1 Tax=Xenia sp. Carnegie-2017 TaxID=2897299 RepID=UPI001F03471B|nr:thiosulfate:glutathione sulfurtransferase-like [Xenia sp. Carnegie-2017]